MLSCVRGVEFSYAARLNGEQLAWRLEAHAAAHAAHTAAHSTLAAAATAGRGRHGRGLLGDQALRGQNHAGDRRRVLYRGAGYLGRVDNALCDQVAKLAGRCAVADAIALDLLDNEAAQNANKKS